MLLNSLSRRMHWGLVVLAGLTGAPAASLAAPTFNAVVLDHFEQWDADGNGVLSRDEIDVLVDEPSLTGEVAAAVGALKLGVRGVRYVLPPLTREYFSTRVDPVSKVAKKPAVADADLEHELHDPLPPATPVEPRLGAMYQRNLKRIASRPAAIYTDDRPDLGKVHQGPLGDCFLVSVVGAVVESDPSRLKSMATEHEGRAFVTMADRSVLVTPITDTELVLSSTTGDDGLWLPLVEKAYGGYRMSTKPESKRTETMTDAIATGGSSATVIQTLLGKQTTRVKFAELRKMNDEDRAAKLKELGAAVDAALREHRVVIIGTPKETMPPGISPNHAYAVTGIDADRGVLKVWNPHGNTFKPKGEAGLKNGWPTRGGRFEIAMTDVAAVFNGLVYERPEAVSLGRSADDKTGAKASRAR